MFKAFLAYTLKQQMPSVELPSSVLDVTLLLNFLTDRHQLRNITNVSLVRAWTYWQNHYKISRLKLILSWFCVIYIFKIVKIFLNPVLEGLSEAEFQLCDDVVVLASTATASSTLLPPPSPLTYPWPKVISHKQRGGGGEDCEQCRGNSAEWIPLWKSHRPEGAVSSREVSPFGLCL